MATAPSASKISSIGSLWDGLNPHLLAQIYKLKKSGQDWVQDESSPVVVAGVTEASLELALNWQSPFENSGTESQAPTLMAMLQTGSLQSVLTALTGKDASSTSAVGQSRDKTNAMLSQFEGRTGITKLNSQQVFNGMQPVKINATLLFRAWRDPMAEVEKPLAQLMEWMLPQELSKDGSVIARAAETARGNMSTVDMLMPSKAPVPVSVKYKSRLFREMVIEATTIPLDSPIDAQGHFVQLSLPVTICSMTAIDHKDWKAYGPI